MAHQTPTCSTCQCAAHKRKQKKHNMVATVSAARLAPCTGRTHVRMPNRSGTERRNDAESSCVEPRNGDFANVGKADRGGGNGRERWEEASDVVPVTDIRSEC